MKKDASSILSVSQAAMGQLRAPYGLGSTPRGMNGTNSSDDPPPEETLHAVEGVPSGSFAWLHISSVSNLMQVENGSQGHTS